MSAEQRLDLAQHRLSAACVGHGQVGAGKLQAALDGERRYRVGEPRPEALRPGEELVGPLGFAAVERDAGRQRADERAGGVLVQPRTVGNLQRSLGELLRLDPSPVSDRNRGALAERHPRHLVRPQLKTRLDSVREQVVGLVELPSQQMRDRKQHHGVRAETTPMGRRSERELRIRAHSRHPPGTALSPQYA